MSGLPQLESVGQDELERELAWIGAATADPAAGVFGPHSMTWRVNREAVLFLGAGRALLLQLAHPWVAAAVAEHSVALRDPIGRFHRTFDTMFTLVFGTLEQAFDTARRLHRLHAKIGGQLQHAPPFADGSRYWANESAALYWVHATLTDTALMMHDLVLPALTVDERERYFAESQVYAALFGVARARMPRDWDAFVAYNHAMWQSEVLTVSCDAREVADQIFAGAGKLMRLPNWYRAVTAHVLPARLRAPFGFPYGAAEQRTAERAIKAIRGAYSLLPARIRYVGPYQEALGRLRGRASPDWATRLLNRAWIGRASIGRPRT